MTMTTKYNSNKRVVLSFEKIKLFTFDANCTLKCMYYINLTLFIFAQTIEIHLSLLQIQEIT